MKFRIIRWPSCDIWCCNVDMMTSSMETFSELLALCEENSPVIHCGDNRLTLTDLHSFKHTCGLLIAIHPTENCGTYYKVTKLWHLMLQCWHDDVINGNIFRVTSPLWGEFTGHRWIPLTKAIDAELGCFHWSALEQTVEQTIETPVIWDAIAPVMTSL